MSVFTNDAFLMSFAEDMYFYNDRTKANFYLPLSPVSNSSEEELVSPISNSSTDYLIYPHQELEVPDVDDNNDKDAKRKTRKRTYSGCRKAVTKVRRNERERRRVRKLSDGFAKLRNVVPGNYKKLSKLDTLKNAVEYINILATMLIAHDVKTESECEKVQHTNEDLLL